MSSTERQVKLTDFLWEQPPAILITETVPGPGGKLRPFTQKAQVPDADLWAHLTTEVGIGDTIRVTVRTIWPDEGRYYACLHAFARVEAPVDVERLAVATV